MRTNVHWVLLISGIVAVFSTVAVGDPFFQSLLSSVHQATCPVSLPHKQRWFCRGARRGELVLSKNTYKFATGGDNPFAHLNLNPVQLAGVMALDPSMPLETKTCAVRYGHMALSLTGVLLDYAGKELGQSLKEIPQKFPLRIKQGLGEIGADISGLLNLFGKIADVAGFTRVMQENKEYQELQQHFRRGMQTLLQQQFPSRNKEDIGEILMSDDYFAQQRTAGINPMSLQRVRTTSDQQGGVAWEDVKTTLNPGIHNHIEQLTSDGRGLFMVRYPLCDDLPMQEDAAKHDPARKMVKTRSPIALFVTNPSFSGNLEPVAIQMDYTPDSPVYTPADRVLWEVAKLNVQTTDLLYGQIVEHLLRVHFVTELFCASLKRQLSNLHPLRQIMNFHCADVFVPNILGGPLLLDPKDGFARQLFAAGSEGAKRLLREGYHQVTWDSLDLEKGIKDRGLDVEPAYFPYRDDGKVIVKAIREMVGDYVNHYYDSESDVKADTELQSFANEVSVEGNGSPEGKIRGFPKRVSTKEQLKDVFTRLIWHVTGQHASVNYDLIDFASFVPNMPGKTYEMTDRSNLPFNILPDKATATIQVSLTAALASLRCDQLFDYHNKLMDPAGKSILANHRRKLQQVSDALNAANDQRRANKQMTYPYMLPKWLPNGIHT